MKRVEAIISPFELRDVRARLASLGVGGMTAGEVMGMGAELTSRMKAYPGSGSIPKVQLLVVVPDACVTAVVQAIRNGARVGGVADGRIVVTSVMDAVRVRTGERGQAAI